MISKTTRSKDGILYCFFAFCFVFLCCFCTRFPAGNVNPQNDARLDEGMHQALNTLKRMDGAGKFYEMDVTFDYYNDAMLKIMADENYYYHEHGCSAFLTHNEKDEVITCRNFDTNHRAKTAEEADGVFVVYHCHPEGFYRSVSIGDTRYFGEEAFSRLPGALDDKKTDISSVIWGVFDPLDGMNEKGFTVSTLSSDLSEGEQVYDVYDSELPTSVIGGVMRRMLDQCATVDEAVSLAHKFNVIPYPGSKKLDHLFVTDASGAAKVIEWRNNEIRVRDTDISTNFYQTWNDSAPHKVKTSRQYDNDSKLSKTYMDYQYGYGHGYERFNIIASTLQQYAEFDRDSKYFSRMTDELSRNLLSIVAQQMTPEITSMTQYSVIYNSDTLTADLWLSRDFDKKYSIGIK